MKHEVLNAKNHEREAEIIAKAGEKGSVTVATNMAGRGVDIILGGPKERENWEKKHKEVLESGGLYIIGTERHESRRIDNQLRGRSGRQGDPGKSQFFVALDDDIMRLFGGETISNLMTRFNMPEDVPLAHPLVSRAIEHAQGKVEGFNFDARKHLVEYDDVLNKQRQIIYDRRKNVLLRSKDLDEKLKTEVLQKITNAITQIVMANDYPSLQDSVNEKIMQEFITIIPFDESSQKQLITQLTQLKSMEEKTGFLTKLAADLYSQREQQLGQEITRQIERFVTLSVIDNYWMDHLDAVDNLRQGIGLRGYGQRDPLVEYKNEAFKMFEQLLNSINDEIAHRIYKVQVQQAPHEHQHVHATENTPVSEVSAGQVKNNGGSKKKLGRNDPCWCGSGKKWKKCHYPQMSA